MNPELNNTTPVGAGPAPTPTPAPTPNPNPFTAPAPAPTPVAPQPMQPIAVPPKKSNKTTIILVVILVLVLVACGVAAAIMLWPKGGSEPATPVTPTEPTVSEEVELTDQAVIADINSKLGKAMLVTFENGHARTPSPSDYDVALVKNGTLNDVAKAGTILSGIQGTAPNDGQIQTLLADTEDTYFTKHYTDRTLEEAKANFGSTTMVYSGATVREEYIKFYGKELSKSSIDATEISNSPCSYWGYNESLDLYYNETGCGGMSDPREYYISKYTKDDNNAYVYISAGMSDGFSVLCDVSLLGAEKTSENCGTEDDGAFLNSTSYTKFTQYKITFEKSEDGKYYLEIQ